MSYDNWKLETPDTEQEPETEPLLCCDNCGDEVLVGEEYFKDGFPICGYCWVHVLKHYEAL